MTERFSVAAVVVTYNRLPLLRQCLAALAAQTAQDLTIFLVDNASTDGTAEAVAEMALPNLVYRNTGKNLGGAGGFAYGVREAALAGYDALWLMDDDTLPTPTALEAFLQADRNLQGQYGWLSSRALAPDGTDQPMNLQRVTPYKDLPGFDGERIPAVMGSFVSLFLRTETVRRYGLPIAEFFIWSDDWEYTRRISRAQPCYVVPASGSCMPCRTPASSTLPPTFPPGGSATAIFTVMTWYCTGARAARLAVAAGQRRLAHCAGALQPQAAKPGASALFGKDSSRGCVSAPQHPTCHETD